MLTANITASNINSGILSRKKNSLKGASLLKTCFAPQVEKMRTKIASERHFLKCPPDFFVMGRGAGMELGEGKGTVGDGIKGGDCERRDKGRGLGDMGRGL